jgi:hypothetical protein
MNDFELLSGQSGQQMVQGRAQGVLSGLLRIKINNLIKICFEVVDHNGNL